MSYRSVIVPSLSLWLPYTDILSIPYSLLDENEGEVKEKPEKVSILILNIQYLDSNV